MGRDKRGRRPSEGQINPSDSGVYIMKPMNPTNRGRVNTDFTLMGPVGLVIQHVYGECEPESVNCRRRMRKYVKMNVLFVALFRNSRMHNLLMYSRGQPKIEDWAATHGFIRAPTQPDDDLICYLARMAPMPEGRLRKLTQEFNEELSA